MITLKNFMILSFTPHSFLFPILLKSHSLNYMLVLLNQKCLDSNALFHNSNSQSIPLLVSSTKIVLSIHKMLKGILSIYLVSNFLNQLKYIVKLLCLVSNLFYFFQAFFFMIKILFANF